MSVSLSASETTYSTVPLLAHSFDCSCLSLTIGLVYVAYAWIFIIGRQRNKVLGCISLLPFLIIILPELNLPDRAKVKSGSYIKHEEFAETYRFPPLIFRGVKTAKLYTTIFDPICLESPLYETVAMCLKSETNALSLSWLAYTYYANLVQFGLRNSENHPGVWRPENGPRKSVESSITQPFSPDFVESWCIVDLRSRLRD